MPFFYYNEDDQGKTAQLPEDRMMVFGRSDAADFQIVNDSEVSREHFGVEKDEKGNFIAIDLGSTNGTFVNGDHLDNELVVLKDGDVVRAGAQFFVFKARFGDMDLQAAAATLRKFGAPASKSAGHDAYTDEVTRKIKRPEPPKGAEDGSNV